jgi:PAS domain S-box-containing protein
VEVKRPDLAAVLDESVSRLISGVEKTMSPTVVELPLRRTIERLPGLVRDLVERLRAGLLDGPEKQTNLPIQFDVAPLVTALRLLKQSIYALIDERQIPVTPLDVRIIGDWFAAVAESALATENRRFADMLDAIPDHLMLHSPDGVLIYVNRATAEVAKWAAGLSPAEVLGRRVVDFVRDKDFSPTVDQNIQRVLAGEHITEEFLLPHPDGGRWTEHHVIPLHGPDGKIEAIATASRDIHARKKAQARLQLLSKLGALAETMEYERVLEAVAHLSIPELADWCIMDIFENGELRHATVAHRDPTKADLANEVLNFPAQLHTQAFAQHVLAGNSYHVADLREPMKKVDPKFADILREVGARSCLLVPFIVLGKAVALAVFLLTPESGRSYDAEDLALAEEMARRAGQIIENARLHQQLRQSEGRFRVALEHANIAVFETDLDLRMRWIYNARLGVPESQLIGQTSSEIFGGEASTQDELKRRVIETGEGADTAFTTAIGGKRRHLLVHYEPLRGPGGIAGVTGAAVDVTELKEAEEQLARELGFRERMMGILGHDLRNPVSAVLSLAGLLRRDDGMSDNAREKLRVIEQSARRMNEMIGTLLDFTRLRFHGSLPVSVEEIDLDELVRGIVAELQAAHRRRAIELCASGNLRGRWDPGRIAQLLSNLASNALWHGELESPVRVSLAEEGEAVLLSVSNRGPVIPPELVERLFEPFQQGTDSGGAGRRGLGLGLFIVREIVRAHGGTIDVRSGDDLTTFAVTLPRIGPLTSSSS